MAIYTAEPDTYAGWSTGQQFGAIAILAGLLAFGSWAYLHGQMRGMTSISPADQLFLLAVERIGLGFCGLMTLAALGSIQISAKSRGTVTVDDAGVTREIGGRSHTLRWEEIAGFRTMGRGGVVLIPSTPRARIEIPRCLDDYRGCIAEMKAKGLRAIAPDQVQHLSRPRKETWKRRLGGIAAVIGVSCAANRGSHAVRIAGFLAWALYGFILLVVVKPDDELAEPRPAGQIVAGVVYVAIAIWLVHAMTHSW